MLLASRRRADAIRVALADADLMACGLISGRLKRRFEVVGYATSRSDLLSMVNTAIPEVALIGCHLEDGNLAGLLVLPEIQSKHPEIRLVLLIDRSERELVVQAFRSGVMGVFDRSESNFDHLCKCIVCVHKGQIWANTLQLKFALDAVAQAATAPLSLQIQQHYNSRLDNPQGTKAPSPWFTDADGVNLLTKREEDLVRLVADGLGNRDIARRLNLSEHTIKNYMFRIFDKLGISNRVELVLYALNNSKRPLISLASKESQDAGQEPKRLVDAS